MIARWAPWILIGGALVAALVFPTTGAGGAGLLVVVAALGVLVADHAHRIPPKVLAPSRKTSTAIAIGLLVVGTAAVFGPALRGPVGWTMGDWGIQHAVLRDVIDGMREGDLPNWIHALSTGDAPLETYPALTYLVAGGAAIVTGQGSGDMAHFLIVFAIAVHLGIAIGITRLCLRVAPAPIAVFAGLTQLVDAGNISAGGVAGDIEWALVHSALAQAFFLVAMVAVVDSIGRPRLRRTVAIWIFTALAAATHPSALLAGGAAILALVAVALLAKDVPPRRALVAAGHIVLGLVLAAVVWMPLGERLVLYGQHFPSPPHGAATMWRGFMSWPVPATSLAPVMYLGLLGMLAGLFSRRAVPVLFAASAAILILGLFDVPYLLLDLGPSKALARLGAERFHALCRPFVVACAAFAAAAGWRAVRRRWTGATPGQRRIAGAAIALGLFVLGRSALPYATDAAAEATAQAERAADPTGEAELTAWARAQAAAIPSGRYARVLFDLGDVHYNYHLTAETGLPSFHMGPTPNLLLRERIEDTSPESLRRFDVRWVIVADDRARTSDPNRAMTRDERRAQATLALGDEATERRFGRYVVREVPGWDGAFARIEKGAGEVRVVELANERVEIELVGTDKPALVALGTGYYPRWRARSGDGRAVPVYAMPGIAGGELRVVSAWVRPGRTVFTPDGELPSDGRGRLFALLAALAAIAGLVAWSRPRWRVRALRWIARGRAWVLQRRRVIAGGAAIAVAVLLPIAGAVRGCGPVRGIEVGVGLRGGATVEAREPGGAWEECGYSAVEGRYVCPGIAMVQDAIAGVVNHGQASWAFTTPVMLAESMTVTSVDVRISVEANLDGRYWVGSTGATAVVRVGSDEPIQTGTQRELWLAGRGTETVVIDTVATNDGTRIAFVRRDAIDPDRPFLVAPPGDPPP